MSNRLGLIICFSLLPMLIILFHPDLPHTSDGGVQIPRMVAFYQAVRDGHLPVRWAGNLNYGYGLPLFNFIYHLPFWISTALISVGSPLVFTFKAVLTLSFLGSGVFMWLWAKEFFNDENEAFWVTLFYQFSPFRLVDILVRGAIGGIYTYTFFPAVIWAITKTNKKPTLHGVILISVTTALLVLSHNSLSLIFFGMSVVYLLLMARTWPARIYGASGLLTGLGLSAYFWLPAIWEHKYTYGDLFMKNLYLQHFPPFINFFIPNPLNLESLRTAEVSVQWGLFHVIGLLLATYFVWKKILTGNKRKIIIACLCLTGISLFFMQPVSKPIWRQVSLLRQFQFPWRLLAVISFSSAVTSVSFLNIGLMRKPPIYWSLITLLIGSTAFFWFPRQGFDRADEKYFWKYPLNTTYFGETDVIWSAGPAHKYPDQVIQTAEGSVNITDFHKITHEQTFTVTTRTPSRLVSNTQYFPGWRVFIDGKSVPVEFQDQNYRGLITFQIPQGTHNVKIRFGESRIRLASNLISLVTVTGWIFAFFYYKRNKYQHA